MTRRASLILGFLAVRVAAGPPRICAQTSASRLIEAARVQLDDLNPDSAGILLRRALDPRTGAKVAERVRGLVLYGAAELVAGRREPASVAFREALALDPSQRVDSLSELHSDLLVVFNAEREAMSLGRPRTPSVLEVRGLPVAARLVVDGVTWTARRSEVAPGLRRLEVSARGYLPVRDSVVVDSGATLIRDIALVRADLARLSVGSEPWGIVYLDDERLGETPIFERPIAAGTYALRIESPPGTESFRQQVDLRPGQLTRVGTVAGAGRSPLLPPPFGRADSLYRSLHFDSALVLYREIALDSARRAEHRARAATRAGAIHFAGARGRADAARLDSARAYFRAAFRLDPTYAPAPEEMGPELRAAIRSAHEGVLALVVELPADTVVPAAEGHLLIGARPTQRSSVTFTIASADAPAAALRAETLALSGPGAFAWDMRTREGALAPPGRYVVRVCAVDSLGQTSPTVERVLDLSRLPVDTTPHPPPLAASAFLPETVRLRFGSPRSLLVGGALGAVAVLMPTVLGDARLSSGLPSDPTAYVVAGAVSLSGIVAFLAGHRVRPLHQNIRHNIELRDEDVLSRAAIAEANARAIRDAPIRVRVEGTGQ